jgi:peptidyl-prolyl cis-trans isomerase B (cyclophilin B)
MRKSNMIVLKTNRGNITITLDEERTPLTAANFLKHAESGFYKNTLFHRVIDNFMIQAGGFEPGMHSKQQKETIENEAATSQLNTRGSVAMARTSEPHSASTQFFINVADNSFLNYKSATPQGWGYCVFGHVVDGMDIVDEISKSTTTSAAGHQDVPKEDVIILDVEIN